MPSAVIKCLLPFPDHEATTHVEIIQEVDTEDQGPQQTPLYEGMAIYDQKSKTIYGKESKLITLSGKLIIKGDVQTLENKTAFQGIVKIGAEEKRIYRVTKPKLLGVIYSTEVELE